MTVNNNNKKKIQRGKTKLIFENLNFLREILFASETYT